MFTRTTTTEAEIEIEAKDEDRFVDHQHRHHKNPRTQKPRNPRLEIRRILSNIMMNACINAQFEGYGRTYAGGGGGGGLKCF